MRRMFTHRFLCSAQPTKASTIAAAASGRHEMPGQDGKPKWPPLWGQLTLRIYLRAVPISLVSKGISEDYSAL